jgi:hypothetical protein
MLETLIVMVTGFVAWLISTLAGGGGALLMVPILSVLLGAQAVAPVVTLGTMIGGPSRIYLFWEEINWQIVRWYLPGAIIGAFFGAYVFSTLEVEWLRIVIGLFLISTIFQYRFGSEARSFKVRLWYFFPVGLFVSFLSGIVGGAGPVLNPFYLNYGALKGEMIGTKSASSFVMHLTKVSTYAAFGALTWRYVGYGLALGIAATAASWVGKRTLARMKDRRFRQAVIVVMVVSGLLMLWEQRALLLGWLGA